MVGSLLVNFSAKVFGLLISKLVTPTGKLYLGAVAQLYQKIENPKLKMEFYRPLGCARGDKGINEIDTPPYRRRLNE